MDDISVLDVSPFVSGGGLEARQQAARELAEKGKVNGCIGFTGHGVSAERLAEAFATAKKLFGLPYEEKMKAPHPDAPIPHRGYSGSGRENAAAKTAVETSDQGKAEAFKNTQDYKESFEVGSEENKVNYNIWLPENTYPGFRTFTTELFWELNELAVAVLEAFIMSLDVSEEDARSVRALHTGHDNQLRLLHYPPITRIQPDDQSRLGAHTDWSLFTFLFQDAHDGLQFEDRATGKYMAATPKEGVVYVNVGDMLSRISNGFYPSAMHRVVATSGEAGSLTPPRYSIPYFVAPKSDGLIAPLPSRVAIDGKAAFEPVTFNTYSEHMAKVTQVYG